MCVVFSDQGRPDCDNTLQGDASVLGSRVVGWRSRNTARGRGTDLRTDGIAFKFFYDVPFGAIYFPCCFKRTNYKAKVQLVFKVHV